MSIFKLKYTIPFLLITVLAIGGVKTFYRLLEKWIAAEYAPVAAAMSTPGAMPVDKAGVKTGNAADISVITKRNLFASRAEALPEAPPTDILADIQLSSLAVVLMGTITGPDGDERAIIYDKKENKQELYQEGDFLQQAAIKDIMRGKVVITLNGRDEMLDISEARSVKVPQYQKPGPPVATTLRRVVGRPAGNAAPGEPPGLENAPEGSIEVAPKLQKPRLINSNEAGMIIKGRIGNGQGEQAN